MPCFVGLNQFALVVLLLGQARCIRSLNEMSYQLEVVSGPHLLGEGPHWDQERQALYFVDALATTINRYVPSEKKLTTCKVAPSGIVSIVIPVKGQPDKFLVALGPKLAEVTWDGESSTPADLRVLTVVDQEPGLETNRFNDGKVDPSGRLWVGTTGGFDENGQWKIGKGFLYSFSDEMVPQKHESGITIANGLAWSDDLKTMYYIDTMTKRVDVMEYDHENVTLKSRRPLFDFGPLEEVPEDGGPDGMTIDENGNLWVAVFGAAAVYNIDPSNGTLIRKIPIPSPQTTSVAFGGPDLDELYVVSANMDLPSNVSEKYPLAGSTFRIKGLGVKGLPMLPVDLTKAKGVAE